MDDFIENLINDIKDITSGNIEDPRKTVNTHMRIAHEVVSIITKEKYSRNQLYAAAECISNAKIISTSGVKVNFDSKINYIKDLELIKKYMNKVIDDIIHDANSLPVESDNSEKLNKILKDNNLTKEELIALCKS